MKIKNIFKSIGAVLFGIILVFALSYGTDYLLRALGVMPNTLRPNTLPMYGSEGLIFGVIVYRSLYNVIGAYVIARLAPNHPIRHVLIVGVIGLVGSLAGTFASMNMNVGPIWYGFTIALVSIPTSWLGGKLFVATKGKK